MELFLTFPWVLLPIYLFVINFLGFLLMGIDKKRAIRKEWRIRESVLFGVAALGGGLGSVLGMYTFRHKTKHASFVIGLPLLTFVWICLLIFFLYQILFGSFFSLPSASR